LAVEDSQQAVDTGPDVPDAVKEIGLSAPFDWSPTPHYCKDFNWIPEEYEDDGQLDLSPISEDGRNALMELRRILSESDVAPRRIEVEQCWLARHYYRGYQFLLPNRYGGWTIPAIGTGYGPKDQIQNAKLYATNVYAEKADIIAAALSREVPKVQFFPVNPDFAPDIDMAEVSDDLKDIWAKNNHLQNVLREAAQLFWTDDRVLLWTRYELNGDEYGYEEDEEPVVPETEQADPETPMETSEGTQYREANESVAPSPRRPRGRVRTTR